MSHSCLPPENSTRRSIHKKHGHCQGRLRVFLLSCRLWLQIVGNRFVHPAEDFDSFGKFCNREHVRDDLFRTPQVQTLPLCRSRTVPSPLMGNQSMSLLRQTSQSLRGGKNLAAQRMHEVPDELRYSLEAPQTALSSVTPVKLMMPNCSNPMSILQ